MRSLRRCAGVVALVPVIALGATATSAAAATRAGKFSFFPDTGPAIGVNLGGIRAGSDGAMWYAGGEGLSSPGNPAVVSRITTSGQVQTYDVGAATNPVGIAAGSDGALWFPNVFNNSIGRITTGGAVTDFPVEDPGQRGGPDSIVAGPDGALWFSYLNSDSYIGRITTAGVVTYYLTGGQYRGNLGSLTAGPDGAVWFNAAGEIGRITSAGVVTDFPDLGPLGALTAGPDGALWVISNDGQAVSRLSTAGVITNTYTSSIIDDPTSITAGPDGNLWFGNGGTHSVGRMTTKGAFTLFKDQQAKDPSSITTGPDGAMWFTNDRNNLAIGKITTTASS